MTRDEMLRLPCIYLAAPLGAGVMLGLKTTIHQTHPIKAGTRVCVYQESHPDGPQRDQYTRSWWMLTEAAVAKGHKSLIHVPEALGLIQGRGHLGAVRVEACQRNGDQYIITLAEPTRLPEKAVG